MTTDEPRAWLVAQLRAWPERVDPKRTTNITYLMGRAANEIDGLTRPVDMVLFCPQCGEQHIDRATSDWDNPPHRSHLCLVCGTIWRPADVATNGVPAITTKGSADTWHTPCSVPLGGEWKASDREKLEETLGALEGRHGEGWINITMSERRLFAQLLRAALTGLPEMVEEAKWREALLVARGQVAGAVLQTATGIKVAAKIIAKDAGHE